MSSFKGFHWPVGYTDFSVPTNTTESFFGKGGFYQNEAINAGETITHKSKNEV